MHHLATRGVGGVGVACVYVSAVESCLEKSATPATRPPLAAPLHQVCGLLAGGRVQVVWGEYVRFLAVLLHPPGLHFYSSNCTYYSVNNNYHLGIFNMEQKCPKL